MKTHFNHYDSKGVGRLSTRTSLLLYALMFTLFVLAMVTRSAGQDIYLSSLDSTDLTVTIGKYAPDGTAINSQFVVEPRSYLQSMSIYGSALVVPNTNYATNSAVLEYGTKTGAPLNFNIKVPYPVSAVVGGKYMFVLYDYPVRLAEYDYSTQKVIYTDLLPPGSVSEGSQLAAWTDSSGNTDLYLTMNSDGTGQPHTGFILHVVVDNTGAVIAKPNIAPGLNYPTGIAVSGDGQYVYVVDYQTTVQDQNGYFSKYRTADGVRPYQIAIGNYPYGIATSGGALFVTADGSGVLSEYYAVTGALINYGLIQGITLGEVVAIGPPSCITPPANLAAWYSLDQSGSSQSDLAGQNTATVHNTTSISGEVAGALQFNGTSSYVQAPSTAQNNLGTSDFSIDAWVKVASTADQNNVRTIVDKRDGIPTGYSFYLYNGKIGVQLADPHDYGNFISSMAVPADNQWHMVAVTVVRNSTTGGTWYLDGAPIGNFNPTAYPGSLNNSLPLRIGARSLSAFLSDGWFKGGIDEVDVFSRALSAGEMLSIMQAGPAGKCKCVAPPSNMLAWYAFDQAGSTQNDLSTNNNTATAYSTTSVIGEVAGALQFNGNNAHVQAPSTSALGLGTSDFSFDAWVRIASGNADHTVVAVLDKRDSVGLELRGYHFFLYNRRIGVQLADGTYGNYATDANVVVPDDSQWHLIAVTVVRNLPNGGTFYLDGVAVGSFDPTGHPGSLSTSVPLEIGTLSLSQGGGSFFKGGIDEVEIFNRALGANEVVGLMQAGHAGKCKK